jgi:hypothetical protein
VLLRVSDKHYLPLGGGGMIAFHVSSSITAKCENFAKSGHTGIDVMIFKIYSPKKSAFLTQNTARLCKILIITLVFEKNAIFSPKIGKNRRKLRS